MFKKCLLSLALAAAFCLPACNTSEVSGSDTSQDVSYTQESAEQSEASLADVNYAPDFVIKDREGNTVSLSALRGKAVVINFWATWCGPCKVELPDFQNAYEAYGDDVVFLMISLDEKVSTAWDFADKNGYTFPVYEDFQGIAAISYGVSAIPLSIFVAPSGEISYRHVGTIDNQTLISEIEKILK